jgi:fatty acid-binding protein DegV
VRTSTKAEARIIEMLKEHSPIERFALLHTNAPEEAEAFYAKIKDLIPDSEVYSMDITPVIGVHIGPGAVRYAIISKIPVSK